MRKDSSSYTKSYNWFLCGKSSLLYLSVLWHAYSSKDRMCAREYVCECVHDFLFFISFFSLMEVSSCLCKCERIYMFVYISFCVCLCTLACVLIKGTVANALPRGRNIRRLGISKLHATKTSHDSPVPWRSSHDDPPPSPRPLPCKEKER